MVTSEDVSKHRWESIPTLQVPRSRVGGAFFQRSKTEAPQWLSSSAPPTSELTQSRVPAGTYPSLLRHYQTVGLYNFAVAHADLPNDLVYNIVRVVFEKHEEMMEVHAAAAATVPANVERNTFLPLHPGAIRYYRQIGYGGGP